MSKIIPATFPAEFTGQARADAIAIFGDARVYHHNWRPHASLPYLVLHGFTDALVRTEPMHDGKYLWQFRKTAGRADTVEAAKDFVEAGAEFFQSMRRNPYSA